MVKFTTLCNNNFHFGDEKKKKNMRAWEFFVPFSQLLMSFKPRSTIAKHLQLDRNYQTQTSKPHCQQKTIVHVPSPILHSQLI